MQIPQELSEFKHPTMIVVTDNVQAKLYKVMGRMVEHIETLTSNYPPKENEERTSGSSPSAAHFSEQDEKSSEVSREKLYQAISKDLLSRFATGDFERIIFTAPQEHMNELKETIHMKLIKITDAFVSKLLTNDDIKDILLLAEEEKFPKE